LEEGEAKDGRTHGVELAREMERPIPIDYSS
jgi:hypothetical protein